MLQCVRQLPCGRHAQGVVGDIEAGQTDGGGEGPGDGNRPLSRERRAGEIEGQQAPRGGEAGDVERARVAHGFSREGEAGEGGVVPDTVGDALHLKRRNAVARQVQGGQRLVAERGVFVCFLG